MKFVKVDFKLEVNDDFPPIAIESLNGIMMKSGLIKIDNAPFFVESIAVGDIVDCSKTEGQSNYNFESVIHEGGHKSIAIIFIDDSVKEGTYQTLTSFGCFCEYGEFQGFNMLAVDCDESVNFGEIQFYLSECEANGAISFAELCL